MQNLADCRLYGILDLSYVVESNAEAVTAAMIEGGVDVIQLRAKKATVSKIIDLAGRLHQITAPAGVPLVVNDHAEVAAQVLVEGIHVGQDDDSIATARQKAGRELIVGKSSHSLEQAIAAQAEGADYIGFGPIFPTPTKPDYVAIGIEDIKRVHAAVKLPIFGIGGIKIDNLGEIIAAGAKRVTIVSGLLKAADVAKYARACKALLQPE
ncbi:MAG TPA: thiamine phosphate synthase [Chthoniobacterales bacterium]|nr:thiamine phosphate synthase [Chthoniobacterales bacterium]